MQRLLNPFNPLNLWLILLLLATPLLSIQRRTVWSGVYTEAQAFKGEALYRAQCRRCHGASLEGGSAYQLAGDQFMDSWREDNAESLFAFIQAQMPPRAGDPLSDDDVLSLTSYIMWSNYFPSGPSDLTVEGLRGIQIEYQDGPRPLPNNAVVQTVGCLAKDEGDGWNLTGAAAPARTRRSEKSSPEEINSAEFRSLGSQTFRLQNFAMLGAFKPESHAGHKMLTKGVLMRQPNGDQRLSLTALDMVSAECR